MRRKKENDIEFNKRKRTYLIELIILGILLLILLILLCNRTFFREEYRTSKINVQIPLLSFFIKDNGNEITLKTLRKSQYVKDYFVEELDKMTRYTCDNDVLFYYDEDTKTAIYSIDVEKNFAMKTIKIKYAQGDADCLCNTPLPYNEVEKECQISR